MCSARHAKFRDLNNLSLAELLGSLEQGRREHVRQLAAELEANPESTLPSVGIIQQTVVLHVGIDAVKAVIDEETHDADDDG